VPSCSRAEDSDSYTAHKRIAPGEDGGASGAYFAGPLGMREKWWGLQGRDARSFLKNGCGDAEAGRG